MGERFGWKILLAVTSALHFAGSLFGRHTTRPGCLPGLPCYQYEWGTLSQPVVAVSLDAVQVDQRAPVGPGAPNIVRERIRVYQLTQPTIQNGHCFLSRVALTLHENGLWTLSMQADQNPWMNGPKNVVSAPTGLPAPTGLVLPPGTIIPETGGLKRNQFRVRVRCYGLAPLPATVPGTAIGKPALLVLPEAMFWVQRGMPYDFWAQQHDPAVTRYFDLIDRVELEFSYR